MTAPHTPATTISPGGGTSTQVIRAAWDTIAPGYDRFATPFAVDLAERLLARIDLRPGMRVLDVATGTGAVAITAARRGAEVVGVDLSAAMIERLLARAERARLSNLEGRVMDGQALDLDDDTFDVAVSLHGVSLFPDVAAGLRELARVTRPGGRVLVGAFGASGQVEFLAFHLAALRAAVPRVTPPLLDPSAPPFQLADPAVLHRRLEEAGLTEVQVEPFDWEMHFRSARRFWDVVTHGSPTGVRLADELSEREIGDVRQVLEGMFRERSGGLPEAVLHTAMNLGSGRLGPAPPRS